MNARNAAAQANPHRAPTAAAVQRRGIRRGRPYAVVFEVHEQKITAVREYFDTAYAKCVLFPDSW
jgi:hypothetical protein